MTMKRRSVREKIHMTSQADLHWSLVLKLMTFESQGMVVTVCMYTIFPNIYPKGVVTVLRYLKMTMKRRSVREKIHMISQADLLVFTESIVSSELRGK
jgi:hypothetical protein